MSLSLNRGDDTADDEMPELAAAGAPAYLSDALSLAQTRALFARLQAQEEKRRSEETNAEEKQAAEASVALAGGQPGDELCTCQLVWQRNGNKPNILLAMCVGLTDNSAERPCDGDNRILADFTKEPYVSLSQNSSYNPRQKTLAAEIYRRDALERAVDPARKKDKAVLITACVCHDLDHPGLSNS